MKWEKTAADTDNYAVILIQTEIFLMCCGVSAPAVTFGSYPGPTPAAQFFFKCTWTKWALGRSRGCVQIKWAQQKVSSSLGFTGLVLLLQALIPQWHQAIVSVCSSSSGDSPTETIPGL